jgi:hypothetical protein
MHDPRRLRELAHPLRRGVAFPHCRDAQRAQQSLHLRHFLLDGR